MKIIQKIDSVVLRCKSSVMHFMTSLFCIILLHQSVYSQDRARSLKYWSVYTIYDVLSVFHNQKIADYSFKFTLETKKNNKISDGILYFANIDGKWHFRIDCDDVRILLIKCLLSTAYIFDVKLNKLFTQNLNDTLIPSHELTGNDLLSEFLYYPENICAYFSKVTGRGTYCVICKCYDDKSILYRYLREIYIFAKKNIESNFLLKQDYIDCLFAKKYHEFLDCVKVYFDSEFAAVLKYECYKNSQIVHSFHLRNFKRVKNDWTVKKIEIKNYLNDTKTIFDVKYAAVKLHLPKEIFTKNSLTVPANVGKIIYERCL